MGITRLLIVPALLLVAVSACAPRGGRIDGPYLLEFIDIAEQMSVCYEIPEGGCIGRVPETVFAVGFDEQYIVAARHPHEFGEQQLDRSRTEYFYLIRSLDGLYKGPEASVRGPFSAAAFERERRRLGLPQFTREISSLK